MLKSLLNAGVPIDGVGLQMHVGTPEGDHSHYNSTLVAQNIERLGKLGLQVHITEMDVKCPDPCNQAALASQAKVYSSMLEACLLHKRVCTSLGLH
jgi:endo-1,4-beta-xylanase